MVLILNVLDSVMNRVPLSGTVLSASILVGLTTSLILFCSHFHQVLSFLWLNSLWFWVTLIRWHVFMHSTGGRRQRGWENVTIGTCTLSNLTFFFLFKLTM